MMSLLVMTLLSFGLSLSDSKTPTPQVGSVIDSASLDPPVTNLQVGACRYKAGVLYIDLRWTSPAYTVSRYDIRVAPSESLINNFSAAPKLEPGLVVHGSLTPSGPGTQEQLTAKLPIKAVWQTYVFALRTFDLTNQPSLVSNKVQVTQTDCLSSTSTSSPDTPSTPAGKYHEQTETGSVLGPVLGGVLSPLAIMGLLVVVVKKYKANKRMINPEYVLDKEMTEPSVAPKHITLAV